jgi:ParB family chromosome partitioning protein
VRGLEELVAVGVDGDEGDERPRARTRRPTAPGLADLDERLSDRLDTRVRISLGKAKGRIAIEFASLGDLERIVSIIDPRNRTDRPV